MMNLIMLYPRSRIITLAFIVEGIAFLLAFILSLYFNIDLLPLTENPLRDILIGTVGALLPFALFLFILSEKAEKIPLLGSLRKIVINDVKAIFSNMRLSDLILISLLAGFAEEILFRGIIQAKFGIIIASVIFGIVHCISPAYVIITTIMGFYIGVFFYLSESLLIPIQMHFIYDLGALIYLRFFVTNNEQRI